MTTMSIRWGGKPESDGESDRLPFPGIQLYTREAKGALKVQNRRLPVQEAFIHSQVALEAVFGSRYIQSLSRQANPPDTV